MLQRTRNKAEALIRLRREWRKCAKEWYYSLDHQHREEMRRVEALITNRESALYTPLSIEEQEKLFKLLIKYEVMRSQDLDEKSEKTLRNTIKAILKLEASRGRSI